MSTDSELEDVLRRNGFVRCDIPACNCGSWHARYGLPERMDEMKQALSEAGHPLCNENGNLASKALQALIAERDALAQRLEAAEKDALRYQWIRLNGVPQVVEPNGYGMGNAEGDQLDSMLDSLFDADDAIRALAAPLSTGGREG